RIDIGVISHVTEIEADGDNPVLVRPMYSGKAFEKKVIKDGLVFATIRPKNIASLEKDESRTGEAEAKDIDIKDLRTVIKDIIRKQTVGVDRSEANVVIAGGRGVKSAEGFQQLYELADV